jgi:hypothetical protein
MDDTTQPIGPPSPAPPPPGDPATAPHLPSSPTSTPTFPAEPGVRVVGLPQLLRMVLRSVLPGWSCCWLGWPGTPCCTHATRAAPGRGLRSPIPVTRSPGSGSPWSRSAQPARWPSWCCSCGGSGPVRLRRFGVAGAVLTLATWPGRHPACGRPAPEVTTTTRRRPMTPCPMSTTARPPRRRGRAATPTAGGGRARHGPNVPEVAAATDEERPGSPGRPRRPVPSSGATLTRGGGRLPVQGQGRGGTERRVRFLHVPNSLGGPTGG